jgi:serine/threonine-protein kinase
MGAGDATPDVFGIVGTMQARTFRVERVVAEGGFGVVYRARHEIFRAPVALKCLKVPSGMTGDMQEAFLEKFREEAELLFRLSSSIPEVVRPLQFGVLEVEEFVPYLALEWLEGETLETIIERSGTREQPGIVPGVLCEMLVPVARALARAHRFASPNGAVAIIHRDLKPENIFMMQDDGQTRARILDYGIARVKSTTNAIAGGLTSGEVLNAFSPAYGAPEQWRPTKLGATGPWTDVWGMAITMTEGILGRPPIHGSLEAMMDMALDPIRRPTPRTLGAKISDPLERVFVRALAVDPRERMPSIEMFWTEIERALGRPLTFERVH